MLTIPANVQADLDAGTMESANCLKLALPSPTGTQRWTDADTNLTVNSELYLTNSPLEEWTPVEDKTGTRQQQIHLVDPNGTWRGVFEALGSYVEAELYIVFLPSDGGALWVAQKYFRYAKAPQNQDETGMLLIDFASILFKRDGNEGRYASDLQQRQIAQQKGKVDTSLKNIHREQNVKWLRK